MILNTFLIAGDKVRRDTFNRLVGITCRGVTVQEHPVWSYTIDCVVSYYLVSDVFVIVVHTNGLDGMSRDGLLPISSLLSVSSSMWKLSWSSVLGIASLSTFPVTVESKSSETIQRCSSFEFWWYST